MERASASFISLASRYEWAADTAVSRSFLCRSLTYFAFISPESAINLQLGEGAFSTVKEGSHKQSDESFAIKIVTKAKLSKEDEIALKDEIQVLEELKHKHIISLYDVFEEPQYYYLVTEKMMGGELFDRIVQKSYYNEKEARDVCLILFDAMRYCHDHKVAHRDLKPENLLLAVSCQQSSFAESISWLMANHVHWLSPCYCRANQMIPILRLLTLVSPKRLRNPIPSRHNVVHPDTSLQRFSRANLMTLKLTCGRSELSYTFYWEATHHSLNKTKGSFSERSERDSMNSMRNIGDRYPMMQRI